MNWMCPADGHHTQISLSRFAESLAEDVIDGRALRHSFESLDDDGSECISAEELFNELKLLSSELTLDDIKMHIAASEKDSAGAKESDHKLDYTEYMGLFPGRVLKVKAMS